MVEEQVTGGRSSQAKLPEPVAAWEGWQWHKKVDEEVEGSAKDKDVKWKSRKGIMHEINIPQKLHTCHGEYY